MTVTNLTEWVARKSVSKYLRLWGKFEADDALERNTKHPFFVGCVPKSPERVPVHDEQSLKGRLLLDWGVAKSKSDDTELLAD